jgi:hypothetical protein
MPGSARSAIVKHFQPNTLCSSARIKTLRFQEIFTTRSYTNLLCKCHVFLPESPSTRGTLDDAHKHVQGTTLVRHSFECCEALEGMQESQHCQCFDAHTTNTPMVQLPCTACCKHPLELTQKQNDSDWNLWNTKCVTREIRSAQHAHRQPAQPCHRL